MKMNAEKLASKVPVVTLAFWVANLRKPAAPGSALH
jgi:hypothetical protein